jgi:hypothetical protein
MTATPERSSSVAQACRSYLLASAPAAQTRESYS